MTTTKFPNGLESFGIPVLGPGTLPLSGHTFFVSNVASDGGADGNDGSYSSPLLTLAQAITNAVANRGDVIYLMPGFALTISTAGGVTVNKAGVTIIGLGNDADRPEFTFSDTAATFLVSAANVTIKNIIGLPSVDSVVSPFLIQAAGCTLGTPDAPVIWRDASSTVEALRAVLTDATADDLSICLKYEGNVLGNAVVNAIRFVGVNDARVYVDFYGICTTGVVEFITTACTNVKVTGNFYVSGTTDLSLNVVNTGGIASTWSVEGWDATAAASFSGGSAAAVASDDVSTVNAKLGTITNTGGTATVGALIGDLANVALAARTGVPTVDTATDNSIATTVGRKTDAAVTTVGTVASILAYAKGLLNQLGALVNTGGTASVGGIVGDVANVTLAARTGVPTVDGATDVSVATTVGRKTDAGVQTVGTTGSLMAYLKAILDQLSGTAGLTAFPVAAAAANAVSLAEVARYIQDRVAGLALNQNSTNYIAVTADFTNATWNTVAAHEILTVTGAVHLIILPEVAGSVTSGGVPGMILGDETTTNSLIATGDVTALATGEWWFDTTYTRTVGLRAQINALDFVVANGKDIGYTITANALTGGSIVFHCWWEPINATGSVAAGAGGVL